MRLGDLDALMKLMCRQCNIEMSDQPCEPDACFVRTIIKYDAPTIDAVPVVRCKDCKHRDVAGAAPFMYSCCKLPEGLAGEVEEDDYCSYGERKDGEG